MKRFSNKYKKAIEKIEADYNNQLDKLNYSLNKHGATKRAQIEKSNDEMDKAILMKDIREFKKYISKQMRLARELRDEKLEATKALYSGKTVN